MILVPQCTYDHNTFENLENVLLKDDDPYLSRSLNTQSSINENDGVHNERNDPVGTTVISTDNNDEQSFLDDDMSTAEPYQSNPFSRIVEIN